MKILAINSSYRGERGQTQHLINLLFDGARQAGAVCESITLSKIKMNHCLGCNHCQQNAHKAEQGTENQRPSEYIVECVHKDKDDVQMVFNKMMQADLIIYATPVYVFNISGLLKILFERFYGACYNSDFRVTKSGLMFHHIDPTFMSKPFVSLIVCDNLEDETPQTILNYFKTFSRFMEAKQVGSLVRNAGALSGHGKDPESEARFPKLKEVYDAYRQAGKELAATGRISHVTEHQANQEIIPVPFFSLLKQIKFLPIKTKFIDKANEMRSSTMLK